MSCVVVFVESCCGGFLRVLDRLQRLLVTKEEAEMVLWC